MSSVSDLIVEFKERPTSASPEVLTLTEKNGFVRQADRFNKRLATEDLSRYKLIKRGDIAFNPYLLWAGAVAQNTIVDEGVISPLYPTFRVQSGVDPTYVRHLLLSEEMIKRYDTIAFGSVPRRRRSSVRDFLSLPIPQLPPLDEQRRIAAILDRAESLKSSHKSLQRLLHLLPQSLFTTMFGDPDCAKDTIELGEVAQLSGGRNLVGDDPLADSLFRVLKISAVTTGQFIPEESKPLPGGYEPPRNHLVRTGDLLMSRANTAELVGAVALVESCPPNIALPDKIWRFEWLESGSSPVFYHALLSTRSIRRRISLLSSGSGGSMKNVSKAKLSTMRIPRVTLDQQEEFASRVAGITPRLNQNRRRAALLEKMTESLRSRAFRGEL